MVFLCVLLLEFPVLIFFLIGAQLDSPPAPQQSGNWFSFSLYLFQKYAGEVVCFFLPNLSLKMFFLNFFFDRLLCSKAR